MEEVIIRSYKNDDRSQIRDIAWETAFMGESAAAFFENKEILVDFLTLYFTDYEPQSCFVAQAGSRVIGYVVGAKSAAILRRVFMSKIAPKLFWKAFVKGALFQGKNIHFLLRCTLSFVRSEFTEPDFSAEYPALLHINIREEFRNKGIGSNLISAYLDYLRKEGVRGVHFATMSQDAGSFFISQGFQLLHRSARSYFWDILHKNVSVHTYGKRLNH